MRVCYFGTYDEEFPRNKLLIRGLLENGIQVIRCQAKLWAGTEDKINGVMGFQGNPVAPAMLRRLASSFWRLVREHRRVGPYDVMVVGYAGHLDMLAARLLSRLRSKPLVFDAFLSLYSTVVEDRRLVKPGSPMARGLWLADKASCALADLVFLDTEAHIDWFCERYHLSRERFRRVLMGSEVYQRPHPNPLPGGEGTMPPLPGGEGKGPPFPLGEARGTPIPGAEGNGTPIPGAEARGAPLPGAEGNGTPFPLGEARGTPLPGAEGNGTPIRMGEEQGPPFPLGEARGAPIRMGEAKGPPLPPGEGRGEGGPRAQAPRRSPFKVLYFGAYIPLHGVEHILGAARELKGHDEIAFEMMGEGQTHAEARRLAQDAGLSNVRFVDGWFPTSEVAKAVQGADLCLGVFGTGRKADLVIPQKVAFALSLGRPVLTRDSAAIREVFTPGQDIMVCQPGSPQSMAASILALSRDAPLRESIARGGQAVFQERLSPGAIGRSAKDHLMALCEAKHR